MRICYIHVGTHKTGTTSIQAFLTQNSDALSRSGVFVPRTGRPRSVFGHEYCGHHNIAWELNDDDRFDIADGTFSELIEELAGSPLQTAVLSSEDFEYLHVDERILRRIKSDFARIGYRTRVILHVRTQADYAQSLYLELIKHGLDLPFEDFLATIIASGKFVFKGKWVFSFLYAALAETFARSFGWSPIVNLYCNAKNRSHLLQSFLSMLVPGLSLIEFIVPPRLNRSPPIGDVLSRLGTPPADSLHAGSRRFSLLSDRDYKTLNERFSPDNALLSTVYGIGIPTVQAISNLQSDGRCS